MTRQRTVSLFWHGLTLALVLLAAWYFIDLNEVWRSITGIQLPWLVALLLLATLDRFLMAGKWLQLLRHAGSKAGFWFVLSAYYQSTLVQRILPSSLTGDALRGVLLSRRYGATSGVVASMVVEKLIAMVAAIVLAVCGGLLTLVYLRDGDLRFLFIAIPGLLVLTGLALRLSLHRPLVERIIALLPLGRVRSGLTKVYNDYAAFSAAPRVLILNFLFALGEQALQLALLLACAIALQVEASVVTLVAAISVAQCLRKFAIILEGWLLGEFTMVLVCTLFGVPESQALTFSLLGHAVVITATVPGAFLFARSTVRLSELRAPAAGANSRV